MSTASSSSADGSILYACVGKPTNLLLSETTIKPSNASVGTMVRNQLLPKITDPSAIPTGEKRVSYGGDTNLVQILYRSKLAFLCVTEKTYPAYMAFKYLDKVATNFIAFYREDAHRTPQACQSFSRQLKQEADFFNSPDADKLKKIHRDIDQVKNVMVENIDSILTRGDKIENILEKTNLLLGESTTFQTNSNSLRRKMWLKNVKLIAIIVFLVIAVITVILLVACQGFKKDNRCS
jgi:vesicle-associated membrane protein 7